MGKKVPGQYSLVLFLNACLCSMEPLTVQMGILPLMNSPATVLKWTHNLNWDAFLGPYDSYSAPYLCVPALMAMFTKNSLATAMLGAYKKS